MSYHILSYHILLVARDETAFATRAYSDILCEAGFRIFRVDGLGRAIAMAFSLRPDLVILERSFGQHERMAFINCLHETNPDIPVLYLEHGSTPPDLVLKSCLKILAAQPGGRTVHSIQEFIGIPAQKSAGKGIHLHAR